MHFIRLLGVIEKMKAFNLILPLYILMNVLSVVFLFPEDEIVKPALAIFLYPILFSLIFLIAALVQLIRKKTSMFLTFFLISLSFAVIPWKITFVYYHFVIFWILLIVIAMHLYQSHKKNQQLSVFQTGILVPLALLLILMTIYGDERLLKLHGPKLNYWEPNGLVCEDFILTDSIPNKVHPNESARISSQYRRIINRVYNYPSVVIVSAQVPNKSYIENCKDYILDHEQLHFDIRELFRKSIKDSLNSVWFLDYNQKDDILNNMEKELSNYQDYYDSSFVNAQDRKIAQSKWNKLIRKQL